MITFIRRIFQSKIGLFLSLAFVGLIAIAFAGADVGGTSFGGVTGGNVAKVGNISIGAGELREEVQRQFEAQRQDNPTLDLAGFVKNGGVERVLDVMVNGAALEAYARDLGFGSTKALEDAEIRKIPSFAGIDGTFDQTKFETSLRAAGLNEAQLRQQIRRELLIRQLMSPVAGIKTTSQALSLPYASLLLESRNGLASFIAAAAYAPQGDIAIKTVQDFYRKNGARYQIPERRVIRYAEFGVATTGDAAKVTDKEIAAYYEANKTDYAATETRQIAQAIASDRATANKIAAAAKAGGTLQAAASGSGLSASEGSFTSAADLAGSIGEPAARQVFGAAEGAVVGPVQGPLGWVVTKVQSVEGQPARTLASVSGDIRAQLEDRKQQEALIDQYNSIQDEISGGADIQELAEARGLVVKKTPAILPDGTQAGSETQLVAAELMPAVTAAFQASEENFGEIVTIEEGRRYALVDVVRIIQAAPPPLAQIRQRVERDYRLSVGSDRAKTKARAVAKRVEKGASLDAAIKAEEIPSFVTQKIGGKRSELTRAQGKVPPELALLFSMAPKSVKTLEVAGDAGWMVVYLDTIDEGDAKKEEGLIEAVSAQLGSALGNEYSASILNAAKKSVGVEIRQNAVDAVKQQLTGTTPGSF